MTPLQHLLLVDFWIAAILTGKSHQCFLKSVAQGKRNKSKNKQTRPNQTYKLLHSKGNHKQNEKTIHRIGKKKY